MIAYTGYAPFPEAEAPGALIRASSMSLTVIRVGQMVSNPNSW
jgi:hypothetical protein